MENAVLHRTVSGVLLIVIAMTKLLLSAFAAAFVSALRLSAAEFQIHDGDRVVFLGDSITEQRLYTTYVEAYALTRHPDWKLTFRNVGWGGDTAWLRQRAHPDEGRLFAAEGATLDEMVTDAVGRGLGRDVLPLEPTFVTVKFGMNDHAYQAFRPDIFRAYVRSQTEIAKVLTSHHARVAFLTPQPIEDKRPDPDQDPRNQSLRKFSNGIQQVAEQTGTSFIDQFDPYLQIMLAVRKADANALIGGGDSVHPGPPGQTLMAWAVLKGLGASALVSRVAIETGTHSVSQEQCRVEHLEISGSKVSFDRLDDALPWPVDERAEAALKLAPVLDQLSRYEIKVSGLPDGNYGVFIDGEEVARLRSTELSQGTNLSKKAGPITRQGRELLAGIFHKNNLYFDRWRNVQLQGFPAWAAGPELEAKRTAELRRLDDQIAKSEAELDALRKPKSHHFEIRPI